MHNQIFSTPQQLWKLSFYLWQRSVPFTTVLQVCCECYLIEHFYPEVTVQNTNHHWFLSQLELLLSQIHLLCASTHPSSHSFMMLGFKAFLLFFVRLAQWSKQQDWSYTAFWYCSKCSSIDTAGNALTGKEGQMEMHFLFFVPFSVQWNVPNLRAATLAADRHANSSSNDDFHISLKGSL